MKLFSSFILSVMMGLVMPVMVPGQESRPRRMTPVFSAATRTHDSIAASRIPLLTMPEIYRNRSLPAVVDNSLNEYWPGIKDQFRYMTCQQYCGVGYVFDYEINRLRNQSGWLWENTYPTHYTYNFMNQGDWNLGVDYLHSFDIIKQQGHMTCSDYGVDTATSYLGWVSGYDKYYHGMFNHLKQVRAIEVNSTEGISTLKNYLYDHLDGSTTGGIACYITSGGALNAMKLLPPGTPEAGKSVILIWSTDPDHGLTVVGYNDSIRYDVNHDGKYTNDLDITGDGVVDARDWEIGGFKIANSYGASYWGDEGYCYALYRSFAMNYEAGGVWNNRVYVVDADTAYRPLLTFKVNLNYNSRNKIRLLAGVSSDTLNQIPAHVMDFPIFNFQGGAYPMRGIDTITGANSIEFGLDVTSLLNFIPSGQPARFFLMVEERDPDHSGHGTIEQASLFSYRNTPVEFQVHDTAVAILDNNTTMVSVVATIEKPVVQIVTTSLPPFSATQPTQVQLEASGGSAPYTWMFLEEYIEKPSDTPIPIITGDSVMAAATVKSYTPVALPFSFPFFGNRYDSIFVNYYGFISFEPQNLPAPYTTDEMGMLRMFPLIVPSFSQQYTYQDNKDDGIWFHADATRAIIRWKASVSRYVTTSTDNFALILYPDGRFEYCYGTMDNQGFVHTFYKGVSKGDELNFDIQPQWNANEIAGKSFMYYPPVVPEGLTLSQSGLLTVSQADSTIIYGLKIQAADAGKITDTKVLMLSNGLNITEELICGEDARLKTGLQASLKLTLINNGSQPIQNMAVYLRPGDSLLQISDSLYTVSLLNPGQTLTVPSAFSFKLKHALPNEFPVMMTLQAQSASGSWKKEIAFPVAAPEMIIESPHIVDGYNEWLDPGEVADLVVNVKNTGDLDIRNLQLKLVSSGPEIAILSGPVIPIDHFSMNSSRDYLFQVKASRNASPGIGVPVQLTLEDSAGIIQSRNTELIIGTKTVAIVNLATSKASSRAMAAALDSLHVGYDTLDGIPFDYSRYASIFLILGTAASGSYVLTDFDAFGLVNYLNQGGKLYLESFYTWYYNPKTGLQPMFKYTSKKIATYYYPEVKGVQGTFTDSMSFTYTAPVSYAVTDFLPVSPAYSTMVNTNNPAKNLEIVYDGSDYKTIGTMIGFGALTGVSAPSTQKTLMQRYLDFFNLNLNGPWPLFHAGATMICQNQTITFTDDSFDAIVSRSWEFPGGTPAASTEANPVVRYDATGKFDVRLTVSNGTTSQTILKKNYIRVDNCSGAEEHPQASSLFTVYPNPATDEVTIEINRNVSLNCNMMLFDLSGRKVREIQQVIPAGNHILMNLSGLGKGLYFLRVQAGDVSAGMKLVKN